MTVILYVDYYDYLDYDTHSHIPSTLKVVHNDSQAYHYRTPNGSQPDIDSIRRAFPSESNWLGVIASCWYDITT